MATIINTPSGEHHDSGEGMGVGMMLGIIITVLIGLALFYMYGWPAIRSTNTPPPTNTYNVTLPNPLAPALAPAPTPAK